MRVRRIAVLIDGAFFLKRLPKLVEPNFCTTPQQVAESARLLCKRHVLRLTHLKGPHDTEVEWLDHVYRLFYYDAKPFDGIAHHPLLNRRIEFGKSAVATFRRALFAELKLKRKFALRLGHVTRDSDWSFSPRLTSQMIRIGKWLERLDAEIQQNSLTNEATLCELRKVATAWRAISEPNLILGLRQKGVDMRIGLDIASMTLKGQVDTIILVTGDCDFVPAVKLARREGVEFLIDPLWQRITDDLMEHVDGVVSVFPRPSLDEPALLAA